MRPLIPWGMAGLLLAAMMTPAAQQPQRRQGGLQEGAAAPDFTLKDVSGEIAVRLSALKGKPVVLFFGSCT